MKLKGRLYPWLFVLAAACGDGGSTTSPTPDATSGTIPTTTAPTSDPAEPAPAATSTFSGTFVNGDLAGTVEVALPGPTSRALRPVSAASASGELRPIGGSPVSLTGSFDETNRTVSLSGGGFSLDGELSTDSEEIAGGVLRSGTTGTFTALVGSVQNYCGTHRENGDSWTGYWNVSISLAGRIAGTYSGDGDSGRVRGTRIGNSVSGQWGALDLFDYGRFEGDVSGSSISGTWRQGDGGQARGTFSGATPCR